MQSENGVGLRSLILISLFAFWIILKLIWAESWSEVSQSPDNTH